MGVLFSGSRAEDFVLSNLDQTYYKDYDNRDYADLDYTPLPHIHQSNTRLNPTRVEFPEVSGVLWFRFRGRDCRSDWVSAGISVSLTEWFAIYDSAGNKLAHVQQNGTDVSCYAYGDSTVAGTGSFTITSYDINFYDLSVEVTSTEVIVNLYRNGVLISTATASNTVASFSRPSRMEGNFTEMHGNTDRRLGLSEFILTDDEPTFDWRVSTHDVNGAGNYGQWIGDYTHVIEKDDTKTLIAAETGIRESWTVNDFAGSSAPVRELRMTFTAYCGESGPQAVIPFVRLSGVDYELPAITVTQTPMDYVAVWGLNPATGLAWETTELVNMEFGVRSA